MRRVVCLLLCLLLLPFAFLFSAAGTDAYAYPDPEVLRIDLLMQPYRYLRMIRSAEKQKYNAVVCIDGGEPQQIGVRLRGSVSLREGLDLASRRVPLELCFDHADPNGAFRGNPSLKLINCLTPARLVTQLVAMQVFTFLDVPAPQITPAFIRINDTDFGLYLAVEDVNDAFSQARLSGGSVYRPISEKDDQSGSGSFWFDGTEMIAKVDRGSETLRRYAEAKSSGENAEAFFDADEFLRYMACETFLMNDDGFLSGMRNFFLADDRGKLTLVPWDEDDVFTAFVEFDSLNSYERYAIGNNQCFRDLMQDEARFAQYRRYLQKLNDEFLNPDTFLPWAEKTIRTLAPYLQRDATISMRSDDVLADLTTGDCLYNTLSGNLLLTFRTYRDQLGAQLSGKANAFSIPQGMTVESNEMKTEEDLRKYNTADNSIIFRVCAGYWRLRRQAFLQNDGKATLGIGVFFAAVFAATVIFVYKPTVRRRRKKHTSGGTLS